MGEIYFTLNMPDSAAYYYQKGLEANPNSVANKIGAAKLKIQSDPKAAESIFKEIVGGKNKKNPEYYTRIGQAYLDNGDLEEATRYAEKAKQADVKYADAYLLQGDIYAAEKNASKAAEQYEQAIYFDQAHRQGYIKYARLFSSVNAERAIEMLNKLLALDAQSAIAYRELAEVYYANNQFAKAAQAYEQFVSLDNFYSEAEMARYATILFYNKNFDQSAKIALEVLKKNPNNFVMQRLLMYNAVELKNYKLAADYADRFMNQADTSKYIYLDYRYYGTLLSQVGEKEKSYKQLEKALQIDPTKIELYKELGNMYEADGDYENAILQHTKYIENGADQVTLADYYSLGRLNYFAAGDTLPQHVANRDKYLAGADSSFAKVVEQAPDNYLGYFWQARTNSLKDPNSDLGLAKPYYEKVAEILEAKGTNKNQLIEAYSYLGYYLYIKGQLAESIPYWEKILALDPEHAVAKQALEGIKAEMEAAGN
ncbi:MAG TPA: tetratricopeptide repeat protein [Candidatus Merdimorpha stercoravium]|uniref:Tetratricopeptide repeat protein n=1 Tax=Candidatus Merdimorpha stercoravium TaxID=2840863 RepID=A0A9D1KUP4_9FLAO|nr:tetratricopeptide repeat protein [Candidatus Merdimorpha stercoravium]